MRVENKEAEEMANLKTEITSLKDTLNTTINTSLGSMSTSFNNSINWGDQRYDRGLNKS